MDMLVAAVAVYALLIVNGESGNSLNATFKEKIIGYLQELCPRSGVCSNEEIDNQSCCVACSCAPDCEMDKCCFPKQYNSLSIGSLYPSKRIHSQCLYPFSKPIGKRAERTLYQSYYMVTSSPNENNSVTVPCGDKRVAPWGSLYPVFSRTDGQIYKNRFCAEAYNVTEWELWEAHLSCPRHDGAGHVDALYNGFVSELCFVRFEYNVALLRSETCYSSKDYVTSCLRGDFAIPSVTTASKDEIITACYSGIISPYNTYVNVFCSICSGHALNTCSGNNMPHRGYISSSFTSVIDPNYLVSHVDEQPHTMYILKHDVNTACIVNDAKYALSDERCRRIVCPAGQRYDKTNTCIYPGNKWSVTMISVLINVTTKQYFSILPLVSSIRNLKSPFSKGWYFEEVAYRDTNADNTSSSIAVFLSRSFQKSFKPTFILNRLKEDVNKPWQLVSSNGTISLNAMISSVKKINHPIVGNGFKMPDMPSAGYTFIYYENGRIHQRWQRFRITLMYFCEQVILQPWEYVYNKQDDILTNIISNDTLFNGEFAWMENQDGKSPLVCLEKSGLKRMITSNSLTTALHKINCFVLVFLTKAWQVVV